MNSITIKPKDGERYEIGYQGDHNVNKIVFDIEGEGDYYLKLQLKETEYEPIPIPDKEFPITSTYTQEQCTYDAQILEKDELGDYRKNSPVFKLSLKKSIEETDKVKEVVPPNFKNAYDNMVDIANQIKEAFENGDFNGEDGFSPKANVTQEIDGATIEVTDIEGTTKAKVLNGANGKDGTNGKSAYEIAVEKGFEGTEEEWLQSLDYEHSDEFTQLATQVKTDAEQSAQNAEKAEQSATESSTSAQNALNSANKAQEIADSLDPTIFAIKETATGNPTIISDSADWRLQKLSIYGQSGQASTTGAQLLSLDMILVKLPYSVNGITFSDNGDGGIKVTGTATEVATLYFNDMINNLEDGETYSYNSDTVLGTLNVSYNDGTPTDYIKTITVNKSKMISIKPYVQYTSGNTVNKVIYPMLNIGNSVKPFEPYTGGKPSPSPDYPQEIISKEVSEIKVTGANLLNPTGAFKQGWNINLPNVKFEVGKTYTFTPPKMAKGEACGLFAFASNTELVSYINNGTTRSFTVKENADFSQGVILAGGSETAMVDVDEKTAMVELGSVATEFEPYKSQTITLSEPITLYGIPVSSGGNVTIDGKQYISDYIDSVSGKINRLIGFIESYNGENVGDIYMSTTGELSIGATVIYKLDTPTQEDLQKAQEIKSLKTFYPNTVIDTGCFTKIKYVADTRLWVENKINDLSVAIIRGLI